MSVSAKRLAARVLCLGLLAAPLAALAVQSAHAADKLTVCDASATAYSFVPPAIGIKEGIFQKYGLAITDVSTGGSAKLHQAMASGSCDIGLGAGSDLLFLSKGAPEMGVAAMAGPPLLFGFSVGNDSKAKGPADLKGERFTASTPNSLTEWLTKRLAQEQGWGPSDYKIVYLGSSTAADVAALETHQVDVLVSATALGLQLAENHKGRLLFPASAVQSDYLTHVIFASNKLIHSHPDDIRGFLKGWFDTIAFMRAHKAETVTMTRKRTGYSQAVEEQEYDIVTPMFLSDGHFPESAIKVLEQSFVDMKQTDSLIDLSKYYTEQFLPNAQPKS